MWQLLYMPPSNHDYDGLMSEGTDVFEDWYFNDRATTDDEEYIKEFDVDDCLFDQMDDKDLL